MPNVRMYIDGFNIYHAIEALGRPKLKWINYWALAKGMLRPEETLTEVNFFTAILNWNAEKRRRHVNYIDALRASGVSIHEANFKKAQKHCRDHARYCSFHEEKQTDVAIAVKIVSDALSGNVDRVILLTADSDQIPTARFISALPNVGISLVYPPGRQSTARDLGNAIPDRTELTAGRLATCVLPRTVLDANGHAVAHMPAAYLNAPG
jgi:uncharacterized LabA/DUF88 family protein